MPATKRSRKSGARVPNKRGKNLKANEDNAVTTGKHLVSDEEDVEQNMRVAKRTKINKTNANPERWTPYFSSKRLRALDGEAMQSAAAGDEQAGDSKGLEMTAMQECQSIRRVLIDVIGPSGNPLNLGKLHALFDTGADDCMMTESCYQQLKELLKFKSGEIEIEGVTEGEAKMTQYVELNFHIGCIPFPPGVKFWVNGSFPKDADFDVLLSGPFLAHHNVIYIDPRLQREIEKEDHVDLKMQKHLDFWQVNRPLTKKEKKGKGHWD